MRKGGFTLIELLVVIGIISLLSSIVFASLGTARAKARDARRLVDMHNIRTALELYRSKYNTYPNGTDNTGTCAGFDAGYALPSESGGVPDTFIQPLVTEGIFSETPGDPLSNEGCAGGHTYKYKRYTAGNAATLGCSEIKPFYVISIHDLETFPNTSRPNPNSPKWQCTGKDWNIEHDWVFGAYE